MYPFWIFPLDVRVSIMDIHPHTNTPRAPAEPSGPGQEDGMGIYESGIGPNVDSILVQGTRVVTGRIPAQVRRELNDAIKAGLIGRLKSGHLKPEVFFSMNHPHPDSAKARQRREYEYNVSMLKGVFS